MLQLAIAAALVAAFGRSTKASGCVGTYFKVTEPGRPDRCMVKPFKDIPAQEINCVDWEREQPFDVCGPE